MRIKKEQFVKDGIYHIYNHAIDKELLFREEVDYRWFLEKFSLNCKKYPSTVFSYCLMPNHFHFLIRQDSDEPIYKIFNDVNNAYVPHYNFKYYRKGSLYHGSLQHIAIIKDDYLIYLCQYIHCNPLRAFLVELPEEWEFSNYREWIGIRNNDIFSDEILRLEFMSKDDYKKTIHTYQDKVNDTKFQHFLFK